VREAHELTRPAGLGSDGVSASLRIGRELEAIGTLAWRDLLRFFRDRSQILGALARPILWLLFMGKGLQSAVALRGGIGYQQFVFAGAIAMSVLFSGMFQSISIIWDREFGFLKEVLVAPISRVSIVLGKTLAGAAVTWVQGFITILFAPLVSVHLGLVAALSLCGVVALLSLGVTALGVVVATRMQTFEGFGIISNFVVLPLYFLSGGVFPINNLPRWMSALVHVNPMTYGVDLMRHSLAQPAMFAVWLDALVLTGFTGIMVGLALLLFRRE
jgi:ABC-2 type transport system permease protein